MGNSALDGGGPRRDRSFPKRRLPSSCVRVRRAHRSARSAASRDQRGEVIEWGEEVWGADAVGDEAAAAARRGERQAEEDRGRPVARQGDAAGRHPPKALKPAQKWQLVDSCSSDLASKHSTCLRALPVDRSTYHYRSRRAGQAHLIERIKARARGLSTARTPSPTRLAAGCSRARLVSKIGLHVQRSL